MTIRCPTTTTTLQTWANLVIYLQGFGTALHSAAAEGDTKEVQRLLFDGAPVDGEDADGCTALHHAVSGAQLWVCEILLQNSAFVDAEDLEGNTPLQRCAGWIGRQPELDIVSLLVQSGANVDHRVGSACHLS